jgi:FkbM family methyltransferase
MTETIRLLTGDFVLLDLGSANAVGLFRDFPSLASAATFIAVDAREDQYRGSTNFHRVLCLKKAVSGVPGKRAFYSRAFPECSSFLEPKPELVAAYGMESYFQLKEVSKLECATVSELLEEQNIRRVDFFKTDLEGLDFEILASASELVSQAVCVQSELRFQPIFQGEPPFHEVVSYLAGLGFELVHLRPEIWKYATPSRRLLRDGRCVWTDALFFLAPGKVRERFGDSAWKAFAKQIILGRMLGLSNLAEYLLAQTRAEYPPAVRTELEAFVRPGFSLVRSLAKWVARMPFGQLALEASRRVFAQGYLASALFKDDVIGAERPR